MTSSENDETPTTDRPSFDNYFAVISGAIAVLIAIWVTVTSHVCSGQFGLSDAEWKSLRGGGQLAARLMTPVAVIGIVLILAGAWMAVVEWRGTFKDKHEKAATASTQQGINVDLAATIAAVGKLRGAALLIVVGALFMVLTAWVAQSVDDRVGPRQPGTVTFQPAPGPAPSGRPSR